MMLKSPGFMTGVIVSLALGIGLNATIFSLANALLLRPLPAVGEPDRLVALYDTRQGSGYYNVSYPDYAYYRDHNHVFSGMTAHWPTPFAMRSGENDGGPSKVDGAIVSGNYFSVLGVRPALGRFFLPEEDLTPGTRPVAVISHGLWQRRFDSDPELIGKALTLNGQSFTVVGIAPEGFTGAMTALAADIWVPVMMQAVAMPGAGDLNRNPNMLYLMVVGRLKPGISLKEARAEMGILARQLEQAFPETNRGRGVTLAPANGVHPALRGIVSAFLAILMGVVVIVLLISSANVANLLLARATARRKEIAVRLALGAGRFRIIRQLLTESVLLAVIGGAAGLLMASWATDLLLRLMPPIGIPLALNLRPDIRVLCFTLLVSLITGLIFGSAPALSATKPDLAQALKNDEGAGGYRKSRMRNLLVIAQVTLSLVLLIGAGLLVRSLRNAQTFSPGFDPSHIIVLSLDPHLLGYDRAKVEALYRDIVARVESLPGVQSASVADFVPLGSRGDSVGVVVAGSELTPDQEPPSIQYNVVGPNYFQTMGIPLLHGRAFGEQDRRGAPGVVIVNEEMARKYWPGEDAVGKRLRIRRGDFEVIGVAKRIKYHSLVEDARPFLYLPLLQSDAAQIPISEMTLHVRTSADLRTVLAAVRGEVRALDPNLPLFDVQPLTESMRFSLIPTRLAGLLLGVSGLLALLIAAVGIYALFAYTVSQRTREIGIRMALGAQTGDVLQLVVRQGMTLVLTGIGAGLVGALIMTRVLSSLLYGVGATDPPTFIGVSLLLVGVALLACYMPARRAAKVDPLVALRYE